MTPRNLVLTLAAALLLGACTSTPAPVAGAPARNDGGTPPAEAPADGKMVACTDPRPQVCTMEYAPVCATRDTGVRCITAPCPSSEQKTFSTACTACSDPKVSGWVKGACPGG
jgi:hypothetical protein